VNTEDMPTLPALESSLLVRTDFTSDDAWQHLRDAAREENDDGFRAYVAPVSDAAFDHVSWQDVRAALPGDDPIAAVLFIADSEALSNSEHPVLVVDLLDDNAPFRCILSELWSVDNNLNSANMDWEEFTDAVDAGGVFRGFQP
jgi:hypothetical protein